MDYARHPRGAWVMKGVSTVNTFLTRCKDHCNLYAETVYH